MSGAIAFKAVSLDLTCLVEGIVVGGLVEVADVVAS